MKQSNIFVYIELSKMISALKTDDGNENLKRKLLRQCAYFKIVEPKFFPEPLREQWTKIIQLASYKGTKFDEQGRVISSTFTHTISDWTIAECEKFIELLIDLFDKIQQEFLQSSA